MEGPSLAEIGKIIDQRMLFPPYLVVTVCDGRGPLPRPGSAHNPIVPTPPDINRLRVDPIDRLGFPEPSIVEIDWTGLVHLRHGAEIPAPGVPWPFNLPLPGTVIPAEELMTLEQALARYDKKLHVTKSKMDFVAAVQLAVRMSRKIPEAKADLERELRYEDEVTRTRFRITYSKEGSSSSCLMKRKRERTGLTAKEREWLEWRRRAHEDAPIVFRTLVTSTKWWKQIHNSLLLADRWVKDGETIESLWDQHLRDVHLWPLLDGSCIRILPAHHEMLEIKRLYTLACWKRAKVHATATKAAWTIYEKGIARNEERRIADNVHVQEVRDGMAATLEAQGYDGAALPVALD